MISLCFVDKESYLFEFEVQKSIFLVLSMASEVVAQNDVPAKTEVLVKVFFQALCYLS